MHFSAENFEKTCEVTVVAVVARVEYFLESVTDSPQIEWNPLCEFESLQAQANLWKKLDHLLHIAHLETFLTYFKKDQKVPELKPCINRTDSYKPDVK